VQDSIAGLKRLIIERTAGNPFFMEEMVQTLFDQGVLIRNGAVNLTRSLDQLKIPPTVQAILAARIDRLPPDEKDLLQTLAVLGREFPLGLIRRVVQHSYAELDRMLSDLQLAEFIATGQPATIRVYWARDIAPAVRAATADGCDVCSISWGSDEANWGQQAGDDMEQAATDATAAGMIVFAASGDNDSSDGGPNPANVDLPSSCPHVVGCGGTTQTDDNEVVWNNDPGNPSGEGTGGGYSTLFTPIPSWQVGAGPGPGRMVPDVAANADPNTGYNIVLHGQTLPIGGTSAVAPLYAGLFASFGTKLGFVTPELYLNQVCFNDITVGDNGAFRAGPGPDPCTGIGSPIGTRLANLLTHPTASPARRVKHLVAENKQLRRALAERKSSEYAR
jgi:hypothetical protein